MVTVQWYDETFEADFAVMRSTSIDFYNGIYNDQMELIGYDLVNQIINIPPREWAHISIQNGDWTPESLIPTDMEKIRADVDYLLMRDEEILVEISEIQEMINPLYSDGQADTYPETGGTDNGSE